MTASASRPPGHPNDWPVDDKNAFVLFLKLASARIEASGRNPVEACHAAAKAMQLEGGPCHWLVDAVLAGVFDTFYLRSGDYYAGAGHFVRAGCAIDFKQLGPEEVGYARLLADAVSDH